MAFKPSSPFVESFLFSKKLKFDLVPNSNNRLHSKTEIDSTTMLPVQICLCVTLVNGSTQNYREGCFSYKIAADRNVG